MDFFFGRETEKKLLEKLYNSDQAEFLAVYGRRRVGKTYLISQFFQNNGIYFEMTGSRKSSLKEQLLNFTREFTSLFTEEKIESPLKNWGDAFHLLKNAISKIPKSQKIILFFDELPWLASPRSGFLRALDYFWNRHISRMKNVKLIICGSAAAWMIQKVINDKGGLHNRLTAQIRLEPFTLGEVKKLLQARNVHLERKELITLYMAIGGIPKYLNYVSPGQSIAQILNSLCFHPQGFLFQEFPKLYNSLFDKPEKHLRIIRILAEKRYGLSQGELFEAAKLPVGGNSTLVLEELEECGFIMSFPEFGKKIKKRHWRLTDEYSLFYLSWIENMRSTILKGGDPDYWMKQQKEQQWITWAGYTFENICLKHTAQIKQALGLAAVSTREAQWADSGAQIDLVIERADQCINLCEIKFANAPYTLTKQVSEKLLKKRNVFQQKTNTRKTLFTTIISPYGVTENAHYLASVQQQLTMDALF